MLLLLRRALYALVAATCLLAILVLAAPGAAGQAPGPIGTLDGVLDTGTPGVVRAVGWAGDPGDPGREVLVDLFVDGDYATTTGTGSVRFDVAAVYPALGTSSGFEAELSLTSGSHQVCAYAIGQGTPNTAVGCFTISVAGSVAPIGTLDGVNDALGSAGNVRASGWAGSVGSPGATVTVDVFVDGAYEVTASTGVVRPDVEAVYPVLGPTAGFDVTFSVAPGTHEVCAYAVGVGTPSTAIGCRSITVLGSSAPIGTLDGVNPASGFGNVRAYGWAGSLVDPGSVVTVDLFVDGTYVATATTGVPRPDVAAVYPAFGPTAGFDVTFSVPTGPHVVCAYAVGDGTPNSNIGCLGVDAP